MIHALKFRAHNAPSYIICLRGFIQTLSRYVYRQRTCFYEILFEASWILLSRTHKCQGRTNPYGCLDNTMLGELTNQRQLWAFGARWYTPHWPRAPDIMALECFTRISPWVHVRDFTAAYQSRYQHTLMIFIFIIALSIIICRGDRYHSEHACALVRPSMFNQ